MLMDLFYQDVKVERKQRAHFNSFMLDVHSSKLSILWTVEGRSGRLLTLLLMSLQL